MCKLKHFDPQANQDPQSFGVYPKSIHKTADGAYVYMAKQENGRDTLVTSDPSLFSQSETFENDNKTYACAPLSHENAAALRKLFPFTAPSPVLRNERSVGVGDRLGIACPGHIRVFEKYDAFPVFAQQSIRELTLTGRTYDNVLDCVTFSVFRENFTKGFGADGDHLKTAEELEYALGCGYTMITLDCSEHIRNDIGAMSDEQVNAEYKHNAELEKEYMNQCFLFEGLALVFDEFSFKRMTLIYNDAIDFAASIYERFIKGRDDVDFEISIDETATPTTPLQHFYVVSELIKRGVKFQTVAPRFCGEFQKGVDYIGDIEQFRREFEEHALIAKHFNYKISVHSGSDKFMVFPIVGELTNGRFHLKTAGTNWLEAMKLVAMKDASLYREVHAFALSVFEQAKKYYHVTTDLSRIPALDTLTDAQLPGLFDQNDARQLIHITYGIILTEKNADGSLRFHDRLYDLWNKYADDYAALLEAHIGRHLELLYSGFHHHGGDCCGQHEHNHGGCCGHHKH
ncbi:tagaturonate epimerase family protein [Eubacteriales bacterium OttesenSCG-928-K08]|nr:tagaturonate epimerase family protein [Eubacteriales bacterium OttesenSCG-928-K08]